MTLKDKEIKWYPVSKTKTKSLATHHNKSHLMSKDVKEAVLEFRKTLTDYAGNSYMEDDETLGLRDIFDRIFGDWER